MADDGEDSLNLDGFTVDHPFLDCITILSNAYLPFISGGGEKNRPHGAHE